MPPPVKPLWRTSKGAITTCSSSIASNEIGFAPDEPPLVPLALNPNTSLLAVPSIWKLLYLLLAPANEVPLPVVTACGVRRVTSNTLRDTVGIRSIAVLLKLVAAPVFLELNIALFSAVIVTPVKSCALSLI